MKLLQRMLAASALVFMMAGISMVSMPIAYSAERKTASEAQKEQGFVASKEGEKYHRLSCRFAKNIRTENKVSYKAKDEAERDGKKPCETCKP